MRRLRLAISLLTVAIIVAIISLLFMLHKPQPPIKIANIEFTVCSPKIISEQYEKILAKIGPVQVAIPETSTIAKLYKEFVRNASAFRLGFPCAKITFTTNTYPVVFVFRERNSIVGIGIALVGERQVFVPLVKYIGENILGVHKLTLEAYINEKGSFKKVLEKSITAKAELKWNIIKVVNNTVYVEVKNTGNIPVRIDLLDWKSNVGNVVITPTVLYPNEEIIVPLKLNLYVTTLCRGATQICILLHGEKKCINSKIVPLTVYVVKSELTSLLNYLILNLTLRLNRKFTKLGKYVEVYGILNGSKCQPTTIVYGREGILTCTIQEPFRQKLVLTLYAELGSLHNKCSIKVIPSKIIVPPLPKLNVSIMFTNFSTTNWQIFGERETDIYAGTIVLNLTFTRSVNKVHKNYLNYTIDLNNILTVETASSCVCEPDKILALIKKAKVLCKCSLFPSLLLLYKTVTQYSTYQSKACVSKSYVTYKARNNAVFYCVCKTKCTKRTMFFFSYCNCNKSCKCYREYITINYGGLKIKIPIRKTIMRLIEK